MLPEFLFFVVEHFPTSAEFLRAQGVIDRGRGEFAKMGVMLVIERPFERLFFVFVFEEGKCGGCAKDFIGFAAQLGFYRGDAGALIANGGVDIAAGIADSDVIGI